MPTAVMAQDTGYVTTAIGNLINQFGDKPRVQVIVAALSHAFQGVENAAWDVLMLRALDNPLTAGVQLDLIGRIVGQLREGQTDAAYRAFLQARIKTNRSDGRIETLIAITLLLLGQATPLLVREYVKAIEIEADSVAVNAYVVWNEFLRHAKDAGTSLRFVFSLVPAAATLKLTSFYGGALVTTAAQRIDDTYTPGGGGLLAGAFA